MTDYPYTYTLTPEPPEPSPEAMRQARREALTRASLDSKAARASWIVSRAREIDRAIACEDELRRLALRTNHAGKFVPAEQYAAENSVPPGIGRLNVLVLGGERMELIKNPDFTTHEDGWKLDVPPPKIWRREVYRWMPHLGGWVFRGVRG